MRQKLLPALHLVQRYSVSVASICASIARFVAQESHPADGINPLHTGDPTSQAGPLARHGFQE
jgi:hypothetical protein